MERVPGTTTPESRNLAEGSTEYISSPFLLVGRPMMKGRTTKNKRTTAHRNNSNHKSSTSTTRSNCDIDSDYVQSAKEAIAVLSQQSEDTVEGKNDYIVHAVLNGEERYEILSVPTCMYQEPYPTSIWIDSTNRTVRIKKTVAYHSSPTQQCDTTIPIRQMSPQSIVTTNSSFLSFPPEPPYRMDETSLLQSLRNAVVRGHASVLSSPPSASTSLTSKERVLQAVMLKWKVVTE